MDRKIKNVALICSIFICLGQDFILNRTKLTLLFRILKIGTILLKSYIFCRIFDLLLEECCKDEAMITMVGRFIVIVGRFIVIDISKVNISKVK